MIQFCITSLYLVSNILIRIITCSWTLLVMSNPSDTSTGTITLTFDSEPGSSDSSYSLPRNKSLSLCNFGTVGVISKISCSSSRINTASLSLEESNVDEVTTRTEFDNATERRAYVLSLVQSTASSFGWPLTVKLGSGFRGEVMTNTRQLTPTASNCLLPYQPTAQGQEAILGAYTSQHHQSHMLRSASHNQACGENESENNSTWHTLIMKSKSKSAAMFYVYLFDHNKEISQDQ